MRTVFHTYGMRIENRYVVISYGVALSTRFLSKNLVQHIYARELELKSFIKMGFDFFAKRENVEIILSHESPVK